MMIDNSQQPAMPKLSQLRLRDKIGYATGDFAILLYLQMVSMYLLFFYTDVFGLPAATVGIIFLFARVWDGINDPIMGNLVDRIKTSRMGKFRPYLLWGCIPLAVAAVFCFSVPSLGPTGKIIYASATYVFFGMTYTFITIPYGALTSVITQDSKERTDLTAVRGFFAICGGFTVAAVTLPLVDFFGSGDAARGWQLTMLLYAFVGTFMFLYCFKNTQERIVIIRREDKLSLGDVLRYLRCNSQLIIFVSSMLAIIVANVISQSTMMYYLKYVVKREDLLSPFMAITVACMLAGVFVVAAIAGKLGKRNSLALGYAIMILSFLGFYIEGGNNLPLLFISGILLGFGTAFQAALNWAIVADTVEYGEWRSGNRAEGIVYSTATLMQKIAMAIAGITSGAILSYTNYVPNAIQSAEAVFGIRLLMSLIPALFCILSLIILCFYRLDRHYKQILTELNQRKSDSPRHVN